MMYQWAEGARPPKNVTPEQIMGALDKLPVISPETLLDASKDKKHCLYEDLWSEGDQAWAQRARVERCRHIIGSIHEIVRVGKKEISIRAVEYVRMNGDGRWTKLDHIREDSDLTDSYLAEIQRLQDQASAKMARFRELMRDK